MKLLHFVLLLHIVIGFLIDNRLTGVRNDCPLVWLDIVTFFILEMLADLKVYHVSKICGFSEHMGNRRASPFVGVFDFTGLPETNVPFLQIVCRELNMFVSQYLADIIRAFAVYCQSKDTLDNSRCFGVNNSLVFIFWRFDVAIRRYAGSVFTGKIFCLISRSNFFADASCVLLIHDVAEQRKLTIIFSCVNSVIECN